MKPCSVVAFYARAPQLPGHLPERVLPGQAEDCPRREENKKDTVIHSAIPRHPAVPAGLTTRTSANTRS